MEDVKDKDGKVVMGDDGKTPVQKKVADPAPTAAAQLKLFDADAWARYQCA